MKFKFVPSIFDVMTSVYFIGIYKDNKVLSIPKRDYVLALTCDHPRTADIGITDFSEGPGWMADCYEGEVCMHCGKMLTCVQVY